MSYQALAKRASIYQALAQIAHDAMRIHRDDNPERAAHYMGVSASLSKQARIALWQLIEAKHDDA